MTDNNIIHGIHELLTEIITSDNVKNAKNAINRYRNIFQIDNTNIENSTESDLQSILTDIAIITDMLNNNKLAFNSDQERHELEETLKIINENLFTYHFQPIVNAIDGEIIAYEALMRPKSSLCPSPYHILKYADMTGNLYKIERATFVNVLNLIDKNKTAFENKKIFINSIPTAKLPTKDLNKIKKMLKQYADNIVVEITEQSEMSESDLDNLKNMYRQMKIPVAVDDYGTGYSNVHNLLRYTPDYVKIDRSLLNDIQKSSQKRYFVREIIDFCHTNNIKALAEGIENTEELQTIIHLGADLIQGYYTAKPSADIINSIPNEIKQEISRYHNERDDGKRLKIYKTKKNEKILLDRLLRDNISCIIIGTDGDGDVTLYGSPGMNSKIHVKIADNFNGSLTIENTILSNIKTRPAIEIGENCELRLMLNGTNTCYGGIKVPESSKFICAGNGQLSIFVDGGATYGIGNDLKSKHGTLIFEQGLHIENTCAESVSIGSGLGGKIEIIGGQFILNVTGFNNTAIGSIYGNTDIDLFACDITIDMSTQTGIGIGSREADCNICIHSASVKIYQSGEHMIGIGTVNGELCKVKTYEANITFNISAEYAAPIAAWYNTTKFNINKASMHATVNGVNAYAIGGKSGDTDINVSDTSIIIRLKTSIDINKYFNIDNIKLSGGCIKTNINDIENVYA